MLQKSLAILILMRFIPISESTNFDCGPNTVPVTSGCVDFCPTTCTKPLPGVCPEFCISEGCNCKTGYIRSEFKNSSCIPISECHKPCTIKCGPHEVPTNYSNICEPTCSNPKPISCPLKKCEAGCLCAKDYIRRDSQEKSPCILISQCPCTDCQ